MKMRYWYKVDQKKQPIPGSNIRRKSRPGASHQWKEILDPCCSPLDVSCTCGPRYFIQLDGRDKPVDHTLIKRIKGDRPEGTDGTKFYELEWKSPCCALISWNFVIVDSTGSLVITVNGNEVVNDIIGNINSNGTFKPNLGDVIEITLTNTGDEPITNLLIVNGDHNYSSTSTPSISHTFTWGGKDALINAVITGTIGD